MVPVFTAAEMRDLDARAVAELGIPGPRLMENAGLGAAKLIARDFAPLRGRRVLVLCGKGNNGGDGFVVARALRARGARVGVALVAGRADLRGDAAGALGRWRGSVTEVRADADLVGIRRRLALADLVVDALLGTGLEGPARGLIGRVIVAVNEAGRPVAALDLPSGMNADRGDLVEPTVRATLTATFAGFKRALLLYPAAGCAGRVSVIPIGIPPAEVGRGRATYLLEEADVRAHFPPRRPDAHKGSYGHLLVVAGSVGRTGAAALAGRSALRSGAGLVTIATPASQQPIIAALSMEAMTEPLPETAGQALSLKARERLLELSARTDAVALGPGLGLDAETQELARSLIVDVASPMVVDADALTALAGHLDLLDRARGPRLLTPHPGEMARMLATTVDQIQGDRLETVRAFSGRYRVALVLKGARSIVGSPDGQVVINPTGNPGMATGGSGDVLTGMVGAFLARGLDPAQALQAATFLHGLAGDLASAERGEEGLIAGDLVEAIPRAMTQPRSPRGGPAPAPEKRALE